MPDFTIPDALAADLRDYYLASPPALGALVSDRVRVTHSHEELPSPRLAILAGEPKAIARMDATASVEVKLEYISSMDRVSLDDHQLAAGALDAWWRSIRSAKRRNVISSRVYLHDLATQQPTLSIRQEEREQVTSIRGTLTVTLVEI